VIFLIKKEKQLSFTYYSPLYDELIPKDHFFRRLKESIDFSFVNEVLKESYCEHFGRPANEPEFMFKLLFLQRLKNFSDREVIEEASYNIAYKFFLDLNPEDKLCNSSLLTIFRKQRIRDEETLELLLGKIVIQAVEKGLIESNAIIIDATHTKSKLTKENNTKQLRHLTKNLRRHLYKKTPEIKEILPKKPTENEDFKTELAYTEELLKVVSNQDKSSWVKRLKDAYERVEKFVSVADEAYKKESVIDEDAKTGYKNSENSFFGYKSHIAMTDERIITAVKVTSGERPDGDQLTVLTEQSRKNRIKVKEILADRAYGGKENLEYMKNEEITPYMRLNPLVSESQHKQDLGMVYNKDANMMQCRAGYLAKTKSTHQNKGGNRNPRVIYKFDVEKCKRCECSLGCYKPGAKSKHFCVTQKCEIHENQIRFQETEKFKLRIKERYKIEAKNGEMKDSHGLEYCIYHGLFGMQLQSYLTAITVNIKRMVSILYRKTAAIVG
jgi:transposase